MWGPGAEQGGILQTSSCKLDLKEPYYRMSQPQPYAMAQDQQPHQLIHTQVLMNNSVIILKYFFYQTIFVNTKSSNLLYAHTHITGYTNSDRGYRWSWVIAAAISKFRRSASMINRCTFQILELDNIYLYIHFLLLTRSHHMFVI